MISVREKVIRGFGLAMLASFLLSTPVLAGLKIGEPVPLIDAYTQSGERLNLADYRGKYVVLEWTNELCPFVQKHYQGRNMQTLQKEMRQRDVVWLTVFSSAVGKPGHVDAAAARKFAADHGTSSTAMLLDESGDIGRAYGASTTPHMYVIDAEGKLVYMGAIDDVPSADSDDIPQALNYVRAALTQALAGEAISVPLSKPYGCSIKY